MRSFLHKIDQTRLNTDNWPTVDDNALAGEDLPVYRRRKECVQLLIDSAGNMAVACRAGQCSRHEVARLIQRCTKIDKDGRMVGFRGCVPRYRTKKYERAELQGRGTAGLFDAFLRQYPVIRRKLTDFALRRGNRLEQPTEVGPVALRDKLKELCREARIALNEYPRRTKYGASRTLQKWLKTLADSDGRDFNSGRYGAKAAESFDNGTEAAVSLIDAYRTLVFDEYTIDTFVSIGVRQSDSTLTWTPMRRFKVISGRRRGSGDIVVCRAVLKAEPDTSDFLEAVELAIRPRKRREFTVRGFAYPTEPCFVAELLGCDWLLADLVLLDNSRVHLSNENRRAITTVMAGTVQYGVVRRAKTRGDIENWHSFLAREFRKLASTTGTGPNDPRRDAPEDAAVKLRLEEDHVAQLLELLAARFNVTPKRGLKGDNPIEAFQKWATADDNILRRLPSSSRDSFSLTEQCFPVTIACDMRSGKQPIVRFIKAEYTGKQLCHMRSRKGERCVLKLSALNAHVGHLYALDGAELDVVTARGIWRTPHRLWERRLYDRLRARGKIGGAAEGETPTDVLRRHLSSTARTSKNSALTLAALERPATNSENVPKDAAGPAPHPGPEKNGESESIAKLKAVGDW